MPSAEKKYPVTPDGRYFVVRGRLWRCSNPVLSPAERQELVKKLMAARRAKGFAQREGDQEARARARQQVEETKQKLGERGPVWWTDGSPDWSRYLVKNTPYANWWAQMADSRNGNHGVDEKYPLRQSSAD